jgi:hypothetical protein
MIPVADGHKRYHGIAIIASFFAINANPRDSFQASMAPEGYHAKGGAGGESLRQGQKSKI